MSDKGQQWPPPTYRTREEANAWLPTARAILEEVERRVPADRITICKETLYVGTVVPEVVGCVAVTLPGLKGQIAALEFLLDEDFDETVDLHVRRLLRWRERVEAKMVEGDLDD